MVGSMPVSVRCSTPEMIWAGGWVSQRMGRLSAFSSGSSVQGPMGYASSGSRTLCARYGLSGLVIYVGLYLCWIEQGA